MPSEEFLLSRTVAEVNSFIDESYLTLTDKGKGEISWIQKKEKVSAAGDS
jgi:hypothetical protein